VVCFDKVKDKWKIYYTERGMKGEIFFSSNDIDDVMKYYKEYILKMDHWHLIVFTRSKEIINNYKKVLEENKIRIIQNDIPSYKSSGDRVFRLFVINKDIFKVKELFKIVPYCDKE
jgi:uncharacterized C2H2 Zn-finger protein